VSLVFHNESPWPSQVYAEGILVGSLESFRMGGWSSEEPTMGLEGGNFQPLLGDTSYPNHNRFTANWAEGADSLATSCPNLNSPPLISIPHRRVHELMILHRHLITAQSPKCALGCTWCCNSRSAPTHYVCIYHHGSIHSGFTALKIFCLSYSPLTFLSPMAIAGLFPVSIVLHFLECHIVGILQ
jgi:hypothetical protein